MWIASASTTTSRTGRTLAAGDVVDRAHARRAGSGRPTCGRCSPRRPWPSWLPPSVAAPGEVDVPPNRIPLDREAILPEMLTLVALEQADIDRIVASVPGGATNVQDIYPLAPLQEGILFHHLMEAEATPTCRTRCRFRHPREKLDGFSAALQAVVARHDVLRTAIAWEELPEPMQVVWREAFLPVEEVVLEAGAGDAARQLAERFDPRHYRIDLRAAPLMRAFAARDEAHGRWLLMMLSHHLLADPHHPGDPVERDPGASARTGRPAWPAATALPQLCGAGAPG